MLWIKTCDFGDLVTFGTIAYQYNISMVLHHYLSTLKGIRLVGAFGRTGIVPTFKGPLSFSRNLDLILLCRDSMWSVWCGKLSGTEVGRDKSDILLWQWVHRFYAIHRELRFHLRDGDAGRLSLQTTHLSFCASPSSASYRKYAISYVYICCFCCETSYMKLSQSQFTKGFVLMHQKYRHLL